MTTVVIYSNAATIFAAVCACIFIIVGVLGNLITIIALVKNPKLRGHATTAFVLSLCTSDLLFCSFSLPLTALRYIYKAWLFGDTLCKIFPVIFYSNVAVSLLSMVGITLNRYILISYHSYYARIYRPINISFQLMFVWLIAIFIMIPPLFGWWGQVGLDEATFSCTILEKDGRSIKKFLFLVGILIPCIIIICSYACIYSTVIRQRRRLNKHTGGGSGGRSAVGRGGVGSFVSESKTINKTNNNNQNKMYHKKNVGNSTGTATSTLREREDSRLTAMMLLIFSCFILCFLPLMFANVFDEKGHYPWLQVLASIMAWASSVINPFIYAATNRNYRVAYYKLFTTMKFWGQPLSPMPSKSFMPSKGSKDFQSNTHHHNNINDNRNDSANSIEADRIGIDSGGGGGGGGASGDGSTDPITTAAESHHRIHQLYDTKNGHLSIV